MIRRACKKTKKETKDEKAKKQNPKGQKNKTRQNRKTRTNQKRGRRLERQSAHFVEGQKPRQNTYGFQSKQEKHKKERHLKRQNALCFGGGSIYSDFFRKIKTGQNKTGEKNGKKKTREYACIHK